MEINTRGIVLRVVKYNDNYNIVDLYTENLGKCAALVSIPKTSKAKIKNSFFQPLFLLDLVLTRKSSRGLFKVKDIRFDVTPQSIPYNPYKSSIAFYIAEFLYYVVQEEESNEALFSYLYHSISWLDSCTDNYANFHLVFLMHFTLFLGLYPNIDDYVMGDYFDLLNGCFTSIKPLDHANYIKPIEANRIQILMRMNYDNMSLFKLSRLERGVILDYLTSYYKIHIPNLPDLKSLGILKELFR